MWNLIERLLYPEFHGRDKRKDAKMEGLHHPWGGPVSVTEYCEEDRGMLK